jgi:hypothetical protein
MELAKLGADTRVLDVGTTPDLQMEVPVKRRAEMTSWKLTTV